MPDITVVTTPESAMIPAGNVTVPDWAAMQAETEAMQADIATTKGRVFDVPTLAAYPAALAAAKAAGGGVLHFPPGDFILTAALTTDGGATGLTFRGAGPYATRFHLATATDDAFRFTAADSLITVEELGITAASGQARTGGAAIYLNGAADVNLRNLRLGSTFNHVTVDNGATRVYIDTVRYYREPVGTGTINRGLFLQTCTQVQVSRWIGSLGAGFTLPGENALFWVDSTVDTAIFSECGDGSGGHGSTGHSFRLSHSLSGELDFPPRIVRLDRCLTEAGPSRIAYLVEAGQDISITNCYAATSQVGYYFGGGKEIRVEGCIAYNNERHGFEVASGCDDIVLDRCVASDNSQEAHNTYAGIAVTPNGKKYFAVTNCRGGDWLLGSATKQAQGVVVYAGSAERYHFTGNSGRGNGTVNVVDAGTASVAKVATGNL